MNRPPEVEAFVPTDGLRRLRVLVVDDNSTNRRILQEILRRWEVRSTAVEGGNQALAELESAQQGGHPYQLILTDVHMPQMDGFSLVEEIQKRPNLLMMAIVMLTSGGHRGDTQRCRDLGITSYLFKPIRKTELLTAIMAALERNGAALEPATPMRPKPAKPALAGKILNILVAEDNRVNQTVATRILEKMGHRITIANNGVEAIARLKASCFDLVLMDIQMPQMDGITATQNIRSQETNGSFHLPIIAMTAHAMKGDRERCLEAGMDEYVSKPIDTKELGLVISKVMHLSVVNDRETGETACIVTPAGKQPVVDFEQMLERLGGDEDLMHQVVEIFIDQAPKHIDRLRCALAQGDAEGVEKTAHNMKGELGYLGIPELSQQARELEELGRKPDLEQASRIFVAFEIGISKVVLAMRSQGHGNALAASYGGQQ